jgi:hypothetical protein
MAPPARAATVAMVATAPAAAAAASLAPGLATSIIPGTGRIVVTAAPPPLLDVDKINREIPVDFDMAPFDGRRRRRRMLILFVVALLLVFGALFGLLAHSYTPHG